MRWIYLVILGLGVCGCTSSKPAPEPDIESAPASSPLAEKPNPHPTTDSTGDVNLPAAFRKIQLGFQSASRKHRSKLRKAQTAEEKAAVEIEAPDRDAAIAAAIDLYQGHEKDGSYLDMASWVLRTAESDEPIETVLAAVEEYHLSHEKLDRFLARVNELDTPTTVGFLNRLADQGDSAPSMVARLLMVMKADPNADREPILQTLQSIIDFPNDVRYGQTDYKKLADGRLFSILRLQIGSEVPEIEGPDIDGVNFKLSDYRGKVVMLDFWGDW